MLADHRHALSRVRRARFTGASTEGLSVFALDADVVGVALGLVGNFVEVRLVEAHAHVLFLKFRGGVGELLAALNLNHWKLLFFSLVIGLNLCYISFARTKVIIHISLVRVKEIL